MFSSLALNSNADTPAAKSKEFSVIKFFGALEKAVTAVNVYPLTKENLVIQQDAYKRLGSLDTDETSAEDAYAMFATLECGRKEKDTDMRFAFAFNALGFALEIEGVDEFYIEYDTFKGEKDATNQIIACMTMLSNGQLACLLTSRNGYGCASEFLLYEKYDRKPTIIGTQVNYPWWWKTNDESNYEYIKLSNHYINDQITPPNDFSLADRTADGKIDVRGRTLNTAELTPLTKRLHTVFTNKANNKIERDFNYKMYRSWEYWLLVLGLAAGIYGGSAAGYLPHFIIDYPLIAMPIFYFFGGGIIWKILETKSHYAEHHPDHPWIRFDELLSRIFPKIINLQTLTATLAPLALSATFLPVYAPKYTRHFSSLMDMAWHYPILYVIPATYLLAIGLSLTRKKWLSFLYPCLLAIGSIATFVVNFALTHITVDTPEPYTTIALVSFFAIPAAGFILWGTRQDQENKRAKKRAN